MKYKTTTSQRKIAEWKKLILKHQIHFTTGTSGLKEACRATCLKVHAIALIFDGDVPVGAALITEPLWGFDIMIYVKSKYRRQGIGTKLIKKVIGRCPKRRYGFNPYTDSYRYRFYTKAGAIK